ncbi:MAG: hypothetical protein [Bacteriophage sp.]|nr:MAG: hypothetical protein [Bacteriophage sp.]
MMNIDIKTADGKDIEFGGTYYDRAGARYRVTGIRVPDHQFLAKSKLYCIKEGSGPVLTNQDNLYLTPPDSWEKLEEDLDGCSTSTRYVPCAYFNKSSDDCEKCLSDPNKECLVQMAKHIASRIHKLRGEG